MRRLISILSAVVLGVGMLVAGGDAAGADAAVVVRPGESIQAAIDGASPGTTIVVRKGTYRENLEIATDRITLLGSGARLRPPATPTPNLCGDPDDPSLVSGICVHGAVRFGPDGIVVDQPVRGVKVDGFTVQGFSDTGIFLIGGADTEITHNRALGHGEYGIFANSSTNTLIADNRTTSSGEAGIYVGDSAAARASVVGNETARNNLGIFIRNALRGNVDDNLIHDNCAGVLVLGDAPGPAGGFRVSGNTISRNRRFCPAGSEEEPPLSGVGVLIASGRNVNVQRNWIVDNLPSGSVAFSGGVVVLQSGPTPPHGNSVRRNVIVANEVDIFSDGTGSNVLEPNFCFTSDPAGLCDT